VLSRWYGRSRCRLDFVHYNQSKTMLTPLQ
jgi:hypothetical protein